MSVLKYALMFSLGVYQGVIIIDWWHTKKTLYLLTKRDLTDEKGGK